jgi:drug/metabolite transporter (DMT)-like permease
VVQLLAGRFAIATVVLWLIVRWTGAARGLARRAALGGLLLGLVVYSPQSALYFSAIRRMDASVAALLLYIYPALVAAGAAALGRERVTRRLAAALVTATVGVALVLVGAGGGRVNAVGVVLALGAAVVYGSYFLISDIALGRIHPLAQTALICTGGAVAFGAAAAVSGHLPTGLGASAWGLVAALAVVCTVFAIGALLAGMPRVGPSTAGVLSTAEPVVAALVAVAALGERLTATQAVGGLLVVAAVIVLQWRRAPGGLTTLPPGPRPGTPRRRRDGRRASPRPG